MIVFQPHSLLIAPHVLLVVHYLYLIQWLQHVLQPVQLDILLTHQIFAKFVIQNVINALEHQLLVLLVIQQDHFQIFIQIYQCAIQVVQITLR